MSARIHKGIEWLRYHGSWPLLAAIIFLATVSALLIDDEGIARPVTLVALALLGIALVLGCLFAFPYAGVWRDEGHPGRGTRPEVARPAEASAAEPAKEQDHAFINDIRTMLISIVVGVFALVTIYLTYVSAHAAAQSADASERQQRFDRLASAGDLMNSGNAGVRQIGIITLRKLIEDPEVGRATPVVEPAEGYRALATYVRDKSPWDSDKREQWRRLSAGAPRAAEEHSRVGVGSLRKRAADVQSALSVVGSSKQRPSGFRADFRDADLQGAELGHARLDQALFSGAHLDYLDTRTGAGPYASFVEAEFKGASMYGAYFNNADLTEANFDTPVGGDGKLRERQRTDLRYAHFRGVKAQGASFKAANLRGANFTNTKQKTDLRGADFTGAILTGANFQGADLTDADFRQAEIDGVVWDDANLTGAKFP
jgi:uncharacterized protein YjbI with pentapeptide repeats